MQIAIDMIEVFADHTFAYRIKGYGDFNQKCCCDVMTYILEENMYRVPETLLKQSLKNLYKADDIKIALYYLQQSGHLYQDYQDILYGKRVGRPVGRIFVNPYHDRYGRRL